MLRNKNNNTTGNKRPDREEREARSRGSAKADCLRAAANVFCSWYIAPNLAKVGARNNALTIVVMISSLQKTALFFSSHGSK